MIMTSLLRRTCGPRMSTATEGGTLHPATTGTKAALAVTHPHHVIQMSRGPRGPPRGTPKTHRCAKTLQRDPHLQGGVVSLGLEGTTLRTTPGIRLGTITDSAPPDRGTHTVPRVASHSSKWTCKANHLVNTVHLYTSYKIPGVMILHF